jgi:NADH-quinone oxidoreductase subunit F
MVKAMTPRVLRKMPGDAWDCDAYCQLGGYEVWAKCVIKNDPLTTIAQLKEAHLRGRGGAGFPTGLKWDKVLNHRIKEHYFVCNAGEHEPGTFKDRYLLRHHPHQLLEGCLIAAHTVGAKQAYIYLNHEFAEEKAIFERAKEEARVKGFLGDNILGTGLNLDIEVFDGYGSYVAGEETAMLESMQGRPAQPKQKPPFYPTEFGLHGKPTLVNNVETLSNIPNLLRNGPAWFREVGTSTTPGTMLFSLSGAVNRSGVYELPLGTSIRHLIEVCGQGVPNGHGVKAVFPGGPSFSMVGADQLDLPMDFDSLKKAGTGLGSAGVIVVDDATCMVEQTLKFSNFFERETCGQCPPCRIGTEELATLVRKIEEGQGEEKDLAKLLQICGFVKGTGFCTLVTGAAVLVQNSLRLFRSEFEEHIRLGRCPQKTAPVEAG